MTPAATVRRVEPGDAVPWERMRQALWPSSPGEHAGEISEYFEGRWHMPSQAFIAVGHEGSAIGFAEVSIRPYAEGCYSGRVAYLEGIFVDEGYRRSGVAAALVRAVEEWGREQNCTEFASDTEIGNAGSITMHLALGFAEVERIVCFRKDL